MEILTRIITRNDSTEKWLENGDQVLLKGEMSIEFTDSGEPKIKIGDGVTTWTNLKYFGGETAVQLFEATLEGEETKEEAITRVVDASEVRDGAFAIVKKLISGDMYEYTAFIYKDGWKALDGNYDAESVYFKEDLVTTSAIGNIALTNGQATIAAAGKNLKEVFDTIFIKETNPKITQPSVTLKSTEAKSYEVGTKVTPSWTATFNPGTYQFGPATGVTVESWEISDTNGNTDATATGSFAEITVADNTEYKITAKANHTEGVVPKTNTKNDYAAGQIKAGSKSATLSTAISGYRNAFYGTLTDKAELTSAVIRSLKASNKALVNGSAFSVEIPVGAMRIVIAYPATLQDVSSIKDVNGLNAESKSSFTKTTVSVDGANGYEAIDYKVYVMDRAEANETANKFDVII